MKKNIFILIVVLIVVAVAAAAWLIIGSGRKVVAPTAPVQKSSSPAITSFENSAYFGEKIGANLGNYLTDAKGMTLYTFTHDSAGVSNCAGACLEKWFPYGPGISATGTAPINLPMLPANVGVIKGNNGMIQFTWKGMPLYYYFQDKAAGDTFGEGVLGAWYVVKL